jgi:hypothetical protein
MLRLNTNRFLEGSYTKFVAGRGHNGEIAGVYGDNPLWRTPYIQNKESEDGDVDFFVLLGDLYNDAQYKLSYQWSHIFNTKGVDLNNTYTSGLLTGTNLINVNAGEADLQAVSLQIDGIGDTEFLEETIVFVSAAHTEHNAKKGFSLIGSEDGGSKEGYSFWAGIIFPAPLLEGKIGLEYNQGSKYWTPMSWSEDTNMGSKIAVRGKAYDVYFNFNLFGEKYLPAQIRYTYAEHDFTPNITCSGWTAPQEVDLTSSDIRFSLSYRY